jgi:hypothetical protein
MKFLKEKEILFFSFSWVNEIRIFINNLKELPKPAKWEWQYTQQNHLTKENSALKHNKIFTNLEIWQIKSDDNQRASVKLARNNHSENISHRLRLINA